MDSERLVQIFVGQIKSSDLQLDVVVPIVNSFVLIRTQQKLAKMFQDASGDSGHRRRLVPVREWVELDLGEENGR